MMNSVTVFVLIALVCEVCVGAPAPQSATALGLGQVSAKEGEISSGSNAGAVANPNQGAVGVAQSNISGKGCGLAGLSKTYVTADNDPAPPKDAGDDNQKGSDGGDEASGDADEGSDSGDEGSDDGDEGSDDGNDGSDGSDEASDDGDEGSDGGEEPEKPDEVPVEEKPPVDE